MSRPCRHPLLLLLSLTAHPVLAQPPAPAPAQAPVNPGQAAVEYTVSLREPQTQMVDITLSIRGLNADQQALELDFPAWRPGHYQILDLAGAVRDVHARSGSGKALACEKIEKGSWMVGTAVASGDDEVIIDYRLYANDLSNRTRHVDDTHAFLDGAATCMYAPEFRDQPVRIRIAAPDGWQTATGLDPDPTDPATLLAPNYDTLIDSPIEVGFHDTIDFEVDKVPHQLIVWTGRKDTSTGLGPGYDKPRIVEQLTKMIRAERKVFGDFPFRRYVFLIHSVPGASGGTEHLNSTVMQVSPTTFADETSEKRFVGLAAHEYLHSWNVKQLRPAGLKPLHGLYDLQHENYTDLLWVAEGTTSYLDQVCLARAGLTKPDDYLKSLSGAIDSLRTRPGAAVQSVTDSSFDAWIKFSHPSPDNVNSTVSFYDKGAAVSFALDMELRKRSNNQASLDSVLRDLYRSFPLDGPGYTKEDLIRACERASNSSFRQFFGDYVDGVRPLDFEPAAAAAGLELTHGTKDEKPLSPDAKPPEEHAYLGLNLETRDGLAAVTSVPSDGPAYAAGVLPGDLILAVNGERLRSNELDTLLKHYKPGDTVTLTLFRYDHVREIELKAAGRFEGKWTLRRVKSPTDQQTAVYQAWLGQPWPAPAAPEPKPEPAAATSATQPAPTGAGGGS